MDDQNKKNPYDGFFQSNDREEGSRYQSQGAQDEETNRHSSEQNHSGGGSQDRYNGADGDRYEDERSGGQYRSASDNPANRPQSSESKSSYYYSYGPFRNNGAGPNGPADHSVQADGGPSAPRQQVEMTPPQQLRPFAPTQPAARSGWQMKEKPRSGFRSMFLSFLAGVIVVGGLMFAADNQNWFSSAQALSSGSTPATGQASPANGTPGDDGKVSTAADVVRPNNIAQIFEAASPAVVKIVTYVDQSKQRNQQQGSIFDDPFFRQFFGDDYGGNGGGQGNGGQGNGGQGNGQGSRDGQDSGSLTEMGMGSGFFFESDGYILTNEHVIDGADQVKVTVQGYKDPLVAKVLGSDYNLDLAVLKVEGTNFPTLKLGDSDKSDIGDWVVAIGNPYGFDHTITVGVLSAKERPISIPDSQGTRNYQHLLQTDASINPGNSGGPLLNLNGEVVGINTAVSTEAQGIGFAIPTSTITENLENLKANKKAPQPFIGAELAPISDSIAQQLGLDSTDGSLVSTVYYKSPAYNGDLRQYDVITGLDGTKYKTADDLIAQIQKKKVGDVITLNIIRDGKAMDLKITIGDKNEFNFTDPNQQQQ